jgi:diaminopimelate epimerase
MLRDLSFVKMVATGNDFVIVDNRKSKLNDLRNLARKLCDRKLGVGADGLLVLEKSKVADNKMRIFNPDGSEAEMCGNGIRCLARYINKPKIKIETKAGIIDCHVNKNNVKIRLTKPTAIKLDIPLKVKNRSIRVNFINTGVPHTVVFVSGLDKIDVFNIGRNIRFHKKFMPQGTNADFVEIVNNNTIKMRTYERGVEDETLACGTGAVASAIITSYKLLFTSYENRINVHTKGGLLKVYFNHIKNNINDVWLQGVTKIIYKGEISI